MINTHLLRRRKCFFPRRKCEVSQVRTHRHTHTHPSPPPQSPPNLHNPTLEMLESRSLGGCRIKSPESWPGLTWPLCKCTVAPDSELGLLKSVFCSLPPLARCFFPELCSTQRQVSGLCSVSHLSFHIIQMRKTTAIPSYARLMGTHGSMRHRSLGKHIDWPHRDRSDHCVRFMGRKQP